MHGFIWLCGIMDPLFGQTTNCEELEFGTLKELENNSRITL
ncbi:hypothetical protein SLEP1_g17323 [Rubroshorea leprosula]|uniref:Uncharacterized protein n=1 Tax=Rubroshorea leprosula TaxID=152421 RepID=A0AAV5J4E7_9ROSI|nr:hypothetical protein SLEP1_g17323 [Rubroshorea leprosula]